MAGFWLLLIYFIIVAPFSLLRRSVEARGLIATPASPERSLAEAGFQG